MDEIDLWSERRTEDFESDAGIFFRLPPWPGAYTEFAWAAPSAITTGEARRRERGGEEILGNEFWVKKYLG